MKETSKSTKSAKPETKVDKAPKKNLTREETQYINNLIQEKARALSSVKENVKYLIARKAIDEKIYKIQVSRPTKITPTYDYETVKAWKELNTEAMKLDCDNVLKDYDNRIYNQKQVIKNLEEDIISLKSKR